MYIYMYVTTGSCVSLHTCIYALINDHMLIILMCISVGTGHITMLYCYYATYSNTYDSYDITTQWTNIFVALLQV